MWAPGTPIGLLPRLHVCGTEEQWRFGQALPPATPTPVNDQGNPRCCFEGIPVPIPAPLIEPFVWVRPDGIAGLADNDPIDPWPGQAPALGGLVNSAATPALKTTDAETGKAVAAFLRGAAVGAVWLLSPESSQAPDGDFTVYVAGRGDTSLAETGPVVGRVTQASTRGWPQVREGTVHARASAVDIVWPNAVGTAWTLWSVRKLGTRWELLWNGILVAATDEGNLAAPGEWQVFAYGGTTTVNRSCVVGELLILPYCVTDNENLAWMSYFRDAWPIPTP